MRILKEHDIRKHEILDAAQRLFYAEGYERCTVNQILKDVGIAKGTFYHYFKSKEDVLDGVIERQIQVIRERAEHIVASDAPPTDKLVGAIIAMRIADEEGAEEVLDELHKTQNALLHQKTLHAVITTMAPVLAAIAGEGNEGGAWRCARPLRNMQIFLAAAITITDEGIFSFDESERQDMMQALVELLENLLGAPAGLIGQGFERMGGADGLRP